MSRLICIGLVHRDCVHKSRHRPRIVPLHRMLHGLAREKALSRSSRLGTPGGTIPLISAQPYVQVLNLCTLLDEVRTPDAGLLRSQPGYGSLGVGGELGFAAPMTGDREMLPPRITFDREKLKETRGQI